MHEKIGFDVIPNFFASTVSNIPLFQPQNKMPRRYLRGNTLWDRNQKTHQLLLLFPLSDKMY